MYISVPLIGCLGGIATPEVRAMMSGVVDANEQGTVIVSYCLPRIIQGLKNIVNISFFAL